MRTFCNYFAASLGVDIFVTMRNCKAAKRIGTSVGRTRRTKAHVDSVVAITLAARGETKLSIESSKKKILPRESNQPVVSVAAIIKLAVLEMH